MSNSNYNDIMMCQMLDVLVRCPRDHLSYFTSIQLILNFILTSINILLYSNKYANHIIIMIMHSYFNVII